MRAWVDIENPPQVQYLAPIAEEYARRGVSVEVTARQFSITGGLLRERGLDHALVGSETGGSTSRKAISVFQRGLALRRHVRHAPPDLVFSGSRPSHLAAASLRLPRFGICDYEYVDLRVARAVRAYIFHPDVIDPMAFTAQGIRADRLIAFPGLKEHISFAAVDLGAFAPHEFERNGNGDDGASLVLFRAPGEETHYYSSASSDLSFASLERLARREDITVVFSPRYDRQTEYLDRFSWHNRPIVLHEPIPFVSLLKSVDAIICSGGTMLREAAYLGVPAYSIFRSQIGQVDQYLASIGRLTIVDAADELDVVPFRRKPLDPLPSARGDLTGQLVETTLEMVRSPRSTLRRTLASAPSRGAERR